jgi:CRISPR-associated protein Csx14
MMLSSPDSSPPEVLIATLGVSPQVVTITLDLLQTEGHTISQMVSIYTADEVVRAALARLDDELRRMSSPPHRPVLITGEQGPVADFHTEADAAALLSTLYREVRAQKQAGRRVHLSISGGRRLMGAYALVVAQLLFDEHDRAWHLFSDFWETRRDDKMHPEPGDRSLLVPVPVLRWTQSAAAISALMAQDDPWAAIRQHRELTRNEAIRRKEEFLRHWLTPAERAVVELLVREGLSNAELARRLSKGEQTIANQLRQVYAKLHEFLGYPAARVDRGVLIAELAPYFTLHG